MLNVYTKNQTSSRTKIMGVFTIVATLCITTGVMYALVDNTIGRELAESMQLSLYAFAAVVAGPKLYMIPPEIKPNRMWKRAVHFGGRIVPSHWLESADLAEYWRKMFESASSFNRMRIPS